MCGFCASIERQNISNFKQQIELPSYIDNSLANQVGRKNTKKANRQIREILTEVNNNNISEIRVIDSKGIIRQVVIVTIRVLLGRTTDNTVKNVLATNRSHSKNIYDDSNHNRYYVNVVPLLSNNNTNNVVGAVYMREV